MLSRAARVLLIAVATTGFLVVASADAPALAYDRVVDITYPVNGPASYIDDYDHCRGSGCSRRHLATDLMTPYGTPVHAAMGGTISFITGLDGNPPSSGYMIAVAGDDGRTYRYIHLGRQDRGPRDAYASGMKRGVRVERGQYIGRAGCSGNASCSAPHLHFEIFDDSITDPYGGTRINPYRSLRDAERRGDYPTGSFRDVLASNGHARAILAIAEEGITKGCTRDRFCPNDPVTRGQMAAFLSRALKLGETSGATFSDVRGFRTEIDRLATSGITKGCAKDRFCPDDPVTRAQMAAFLSRGLELKETSGATFSDVRGFRTEIDRLATSGITKGCAKDRFCPDDPVTRAQMATFIYRAVLQ